MTKEDPRLLWAKGATLDEISQNGDGTYDGSRALSVLSGLDGREIQWMFNRFKELAVAGYDAGDRKRIVEREAAGKPWLRQDNEG